MPIKSEDTSSSAVVVDVGATNVRFARMSAPGRLAPIFQYATSRFPDLQTAFAHFLNAEKGPQPARIALAVAAPVYGDEVNLTNSRWKFSIRQLKKDLNLKQLAVANDLEALAMVLPYLDSEHMLSIGVQGNKRSIDAPMAVISPGTGAGIAGLVPTGHRWRPIASEGGHTSLSPLTEKEMAVWQILRDRYGRVSVERVLSGPGIVELHTALAFLEGKETDVLRPEEIVRRARNRESSLAVETVEMFCCWLGDVAGDVALMYIARGGIYLAGGIVRNIFEILMRSQFRRRFENKGRGTTIVTDTPTFLISSEAPVLLGCTYLRLSE